MTKIRQNSEYRKKQSELTKKQWSDPEFKKKMKKVWAAPERRKRRSQKIKEIWANPEYQERMKKQWTPERRKRHSQRMKQLWASPEHKEKMSKIQQSPEYKEKMIKIYNSSEHKEKMLNIYQSSEFREMRSKNARELWKDPEYREKSSKINKERWEDLKYRAKMSGENASNWQGGISFEPYPTGFNDYLKMKIKERDRWKCILCPSRENLGVHHINYDKADLSEENLITLCDKCHGKTNYNRDYWEAFLTLLIEQKESLKIPLVNIEPLSQDLTYSIIGGISDGT